ncbi:hypothetical protein M8494_29355 [Serratia ureilytica]
MSLSNNLLRRQVDGLLYTSVDRHPWFDPDPRFRHPLRDDRHHRQPGRRLRHSRRRTRRRPARRPAICCSTAIATSAFLSAPPTMLNAQDRLNGWRAMRCWRRASRRDAWIFGAHPPGGCRPPSVCARPATARRFTSNEQQALGLPVAGGAWALRAPDDLALILF